MKRVIEFRGKKTNRNKSENFETLENKSEKEAWIYGNLATGMGGALYIMPECYTSGLIMINDDGDNDEDFIPEYGTDLYLGGWTHVDDETVGQFTGLHDKNGTKIFEGDILKWDASIFGCEFNEIVEWDYELFYTRINDWETHCKIIGNIHDNPELLK